MGLRCSLLGHDFGDTVTERDRNEQGSEVVITVRELRTCRRCGAERVVSENTEVRHLGVENARDTTLEDGATTGEESASEGTVENSPDSTTDPQSVPEQAAEGYTVADETDRDVEQDISDLVESAEPASPGTGPGGRTASAAEHETPTEQPDAAEETAEIIEEEGPSVKNGGDGAAEPEGETAELDDDTTEPDGETVESSGKTTETEGETAELDDDTAEPDDETTEPEVETVEDAVEGDAKGESVIDDAIIMDETMEGDVDRGSDLGRREMVDAGNMFDVTPPEDGNGDGGSDPGDRRNGDAEWETTVSTEEPFSGEDGHLGGGEPDWSDGDSSTEPTSTEESAFQFGPRPDGDHQGTPGSGIKAAGPLDVDGPPSDAMDASFECPACGYTVPAAGSSLRAGDICPDCHDGYLMERR